MKKSLPQGSFSYFAFTYVQFTTEPKGRPNRQELAG